MPENPWESQFRSRMTIFEQDARRTGRSVSIKVRVSSGCFHREHSPHAYAFLDNYIRTHHVDDGQIQEHESGPELLVWAAVTTAAISLAKSVIDLVTAIVKARSEGIRKGDHPADPIELIVRTVGNDRQVVQETVLRLSSQMPIDPKLIAQSLNAAVTKVLAPEATAKGVPQTEPPTDIDPGTGE